MSARWSKKKIVLISIACLLALIVIAGAVYVGTYYHADLYAESCISQPPDGVTIRDISGGLAFYPSAENDAHTGLIFYPGGKVEYTAYAPLMNLLAEEGITCVLLHMPCNLAILDIDAAEDARQQFSDIGSWYIGGHSLGGVASAMYLSDNADGYDGIIFLGAYSSSDLSAENIGALSIYGSEDGVMDREKYEESKINLPSDFTEYVIEGGCHAGFGSYGAQKGDGEPAITAERQQELAAGLIYDWMEGRK